MGHIQKLRNVTRKWFLGHKKVYLAYVTMEKVGSLLRNTGQLLNKKKTKQSGVTLKNVADLKFELFLRNDKIP